MLHFRFELANPELIVHFEKEINELQSSSNLFIRLIANRILSQYSREETVLKRFNKRPSVIYSFTLPSLASHNTNIQKESNSAMSLEDLALKIRPFDIEVRRIAKITQIPEDNIFYQVTHYFKQLKNESIWSTGFDELDVQGIQKFLEEIGLNCSCWKPHIAISRRAIAYICAELYDSGYFQIAQIANMLIYFDRSFVLYRPINRPPYIFSIQEAPSYTSDRSVQTWMNLASQSLPLLNTLTSTEQIVLCEWTKLKYFYDINIEEERISTIRAVEDKYLWDRLDIEKGLQPFSRFVKCQAEEYLHINETLDNLIVSGSNDGFDTPGAYWIAFNPSMGKELGWHPIEMVKGSWFRWANQAGDLVVESIWWNDGLPEQHFRYPSCEIGSGWLVLASQQGFEDIKKWAVGRLSRGGIIRRSLGLHGDGGKTTAVDILPIF
jgi:hypothetical protein